VFRLLGWKASAECGMWWAVLSGVSSTNCHVLPRTALYCREGELYRGQLRRNDDGILDCLLMFRSKGAQVGAGGRRRAHPFGCGCKGLNWCSRAILWLFPLCFRASETPAVPCPVTHSCAAT
jgi:hypothetical protein